MELNKQRRQGKVLTRWRGVVPLKHCSVVELGNGEVIGTLEALLEIVHRQGGSQIDDDVVNELRAQRLSMPSPAGLADQGSTLAIERVAMAGEGSQPSAATLAPDASASANVESPAQNPSPNVEPLPQQEGAIPPPNQQCASPYQDLASVFPNADIPSPAAAATSLDEHVWNALY